MQQAIGQGQLGQSPQMVQQSSLAQAQQQMAQSQIAQQQIAQNQIAHQQMAQQQHMAHQQQQQQQLAQSQLTQQQIAQSQIAQQQIAQQQMAQTQIVQQHNMAQSQLAQHQISQPQIFQQQITQPQMIQQQLAQQQIGQQQLQQMMYCPTVRLVYDTPMQIMQSGDQIQQQNQNIFVNQPPWARPVQNQVIYVQQIGNNLVPVQHLDPNMFLQQNIPMYQQVVQNVPQLVQNLPQTVQTIGPQGQIRQIINNIPAGMMPSFGTNVQRIQDPSLGQVVQNFGVVQPSNDVTMNNVANNEVDRQNVTSQGNVQQNAPAQEVMQVYRQVVPQINQQQIRTQVPVSQQNNVQSMQSVGQQIITNMGQTIGTNIRPVANVGINTASSIGVKVNNVRPNTTQVVPNTAPNINQIIRTSSSQNVNTTGNNVGTNVQQVRHIIQAQNVNIVPQSHPQNVQNTPGVGIQSYATSVGTLNTVTYSAVRNGQPYTYRAIQPKPNSNNIRPNFKPRVSQMPPVRRLVAPNVLNTPNMNQNGNINQNTNINQTTNINQSAHINQNTHINQNVNINQNVPISTNTIATSANYIKMETDSSTFNRKRKSESPDEIHKKISNYGSITVTAQVKDKIKAKYANTSEIGVNTSPVHKMHKVNPSKVEHQQNQLPLLQINPMEAKIKKEFLSPTGIAVNPTSVLNNNANIPIKMEIGVDIKDKKDQKDVSQQTEEKLVRKTVFPQAKSTGRLLDAKAGLDMPKIDEPINNINIVNNETILSSRVNYESKYNTNTNSMNNEIKQAPQTSYKQDTTLTDKSGMQDTNILKSTLPITKQPISTIPNAVTPVNMSAITKKPSDKNVETKPPPALLEINAPVLQSKEKLAKEVVPTQIKEIKPVTNEITPIKETVSEIPKSEKPIEPCKTEPLILDTSKVPTESDFEQEIKDSKIEKKEYKNISINEIKGKEIHMVDGNIHREERDFVLTHVLDGFVIQESNVPFAIRRPLKEKTVNAFVEDKNDPCIKAAKEEIRGHILELSQLHLNESKEKERIEKERLKENEEGEKTIETEEEQVNSETKIEEPIEDDIAKDNPFESLKASEVKTWTVEELVGHLAKYNWNETVSLLQEHEIDGESLFLVTKTQLVTIGLNETHAEVICDFVGSK